ncbi:SDR family NAD(P)-dependent oxidoreductase [Cryobacterium sp. PH29-G1]|uniref:SDR family NAD(P)-dependent oxidoreductase n=1 Tax=Cryobacterium sp. PH29-G1 TaxID=3046211 RepID=UPI0024B9C8A1|nr:SDR family NAD(P)-dependent oxidoreductase [Cryobacterium sp. PH29-G1]MDJ0350767.1 SDR family NAD(P)-dependent oxidoreductase [Cryobacterium sp. PH29-G1]
MSTAALIWVRSWASKWQAARTRSAVTDCTGRTVFITGGSQGIGAATARRFAAGGASLVIVDSDRAALAEFMSELGPSHLGVTADVTDSDSLNVAVELAIARFGGIDVVVVNAGIGSASTVLASDIERLARIIDVNLTGVMRTIKATLEAVAASRGHFLLMSSAAVFKNLPRANAYAAAKAGVAALGGALRLEVAHKGVTVGVAHPGWIATGMIAGSSTRSGTSGSLPWPFNVVTDVDACAARLVAAIIRRDRTVYIPGALAFVDTFRFLSTGRLWDAYMKPRSARQVRVWESECAESAREATLQPVKTVS